MFSRITGVKESETWKRSWRGKPRRKSKKDGADENETIMLNARIQVLEMNQAIHYQQVLANLNA